MKAGINAAAAERKYLAMQLNRIIKTNKKVKYLFMQIIYEKLHTHQKAINLNVVK